MKTKKAAEAALEIHYKDMQNTSYQQINPRINDPVDLRQSQRASATQDKITTKV